MKKTLSFMVMAFALLFAQCRKPEVKFPTPSAADEGTTVSMTVTAGPGSKTDITTAGGITWSTGDKLYVGDGTKYVGYLTLVSGEDTPTGTFSGDVTLTDASDGGKTFHFYYLGSTVAPDAGATEVDVDFSSQNIYNNGGKLENASKHHVGYGSANGTVSGGFVTGINVTMVSKVALARFSFKNNGGTAYTDALTLSGTGIYNKMTVNFNSAGFACEGTKGGITLVGGYGERYVMLIPTSSTTGSQTLNFGGGALGGTATLEDGIEANKFYRMSDGSAIEVTVKPKPAPKFSVGVSTTVEFSPGNLYYNGSKFYFEENQWSFASTWNASHVSHFKWSDAAHAVTGDGDFYGDLFCANNFTVTGDSHTWRTLSKAEWNYLLNTRTNATNLRAWKDLGNNVKGLVILSDGTDASVMSSISSTADLATYGAVFLPAAGSRFETSVTDVGSEGKYWSSTIDEDPILWLEGPSYCSISSFQANMYMGDFRSGSSVRLVR